MMGGTIEEASAECFTCGWQAFGEDARKLGQLHSRKGHHVFAEVLRQYSYVYRDGRSV